LTQGILWNSGVDLCFSNTAFEVVALAREGSFLFLIFLAKSFRALLFRQLADMAQS